MMLYTWVNFTRSSSNLTLRGMKRHPVEHARRAILLLQMQ
jgi:hypothetical protein